MITTPKWQHLLACMLLGAALSSCGGGGGGGSGSSSSGGGSSGGGSSGGGSSGGGSGSVQFSADRTTLAFDYIEGNQTPLSQNVTITATGSFSGSIYLGAIATGQGVNPTIDLTILSQTQGQFTVRAVPNLPLGTYTGTIQLMACSDQNCNSQVGNSPVRLTYTTTVHTSLHVSMETVNLTAVSGTGATQDLTVTLPWMSTAFTAQSGDSSWLSVSSPNATTLRLDARSIPAGTRQTTVMVTSGDYTRPITVNYTASVPPGGEHDLDTSPTSIALSAVEGTQSAPRTLNVRAPTWEPQAETRISLEILDGSHFGWLSATAVPGGYSVIADAHQVPAATYQGQVTISVDPPGHPVIVPVTFTVGVGLATPAAIDVTVDSNVTLASAALRGTVPVNMVTGEPIEWTATDDRNWLVMTRSSGTTGSNIEYVIDPARLDLDYQPYGEDWATVVIHPANPRMTPVEFRVNVHKRLAQIFTIAPYYQIQGQASRHVIRGRGFIANRDWSQELLINGVPAGSRVTRVSDTEFRVNIAASTAGSVYFEPTNELVAAPAADPLRVLPVRNYGYTVIPTGYLVRTLIHNHEFETLYALEDLSDNPRLFGFTQFNGSWQANGHVVIPGAKDVTEAIDGRGLYAAGDLGFQGISYPNLSPPFMPPGGMYVAPHGSNVIQTNDRRIWFSTGQQGLAYFDFPSGEVVTVADQLSGGNQGPWFARSGDGARLFLSMAQGGSQYPALLLNTSDYLLQQAPSTGIDNQLVEGSVSDDGSRSINEWRRVRDAQFQVIGVAEESLADWVTTGAVISRDGRRAYTFVFDFDDFGRTTPIHHPRIYVFDITTPVGVDVPFPTLGYFELADYPICFTPGVANCRTNPRMKVSPDKATLFIAGGFNIVITPIPAENTLATAGSPPPVLGKQGIRTKLWRAR